jgi:hypothetical protein
MSVLEPSQPPSQWVPEFLSPGIMPSEVVSDHSQVVPKLKCVVFIATHPQILIGSWSSTGASLHLSSAHKTPQPDLTHWPNSIQKTYREGTRPPQGLTARWINRDIPLFLAKHWCFNPHKKTHGRNTCEAFLLKYWSHPEDGHHWPNHVKALLFTKTLLHSMKVNTNFTYTLHL